MNAGDVAEWVVFAIAALAAIVAAIGVVTQRNPVHAALSLVGTLFAVAVLFVLQEAHFLAAVQIIVYAGAIVVLFLFVIMLLGVDRHEDLDEPLPFQRWIAAAVGVGALALFGVLLGRGNGKPGDGPGPWAPGRRPTTSTTSASACSATTCGPSRSRRCCSSSRWWARWCSSGDAAAESPGPPTPPDPRNEPGGAGGDDDHRGGAAWLDVGRAPVPRRGGGDLRDRRRGPAHPQERARHVHVRRADAERREPDVRDLRPQPRRHRRSGHGLLHDGGRGGRGRHRAGDHRVDLPAPQGRAPPTTSTCCRAEPVSLLETSSGSSRSSRSSGFCCSRLRRAASSEPAAGARPR